MELIEIGLVLAVLSVFILTLDTEVLFLFLIEVIMALMIIVPFGILLTGLMILARAIEKIIIFLRAEFTNMNNV